MGWSIFAPRPVLSWHSNSGKTKTNKEIIWLPLRPFLKGLDILLPVFKRCNAANLAPSSHAQRSLLAKDLWLKQQTLWMRRNHRCVGKGCQVQVYSLMAMGPVGPTGCCLLWRALAIQITPLPELLHLLCRRLWVVSRVCPPSCHSPAHLPLPRSHWSGWGSSSHVALLLWAFDSAAGLRKEWKKASGRHFFPTERCLGICFTTTITMGVQTSPAPFFWLLTLYTAYYKPKKTNCKGGWYHAKKASSLFQSISVKFHSRRGSHSQNSPLKRETVMCW